MSADSEITFDVSQLGISSHAVSLFVSEFYRDALRHEAQDLLNDLRDRSGRLHLDGQNLVQTVLSDRNPALALNDRETRNEQNQHASLCYLMLAVTTGVRNIYTHDVEAEVSREDAAIWLTLMGRLRGQVSRLEVVDSAPDDPPVR